MSVWSEFGFSENPYSARPIRPTPADAEMLVGREKELLRLMQYLKSSSTHPTIEGPNGVGKTSLVAVAGYRLTEQFDKGEIKQLFLTVPGQFQLRADMDLAAFKLEVFFAVASTILAQIDRIWSTGARVVERDELEQWLKSPIFESKTGGGSLAGFGANFGQGSSANTSKGFTEAGFVQRVRDWLGTAFPDLQKGGVICLLDNLEVLETSAKARQLLEQLRDEVLGITGLRWVLCGARGIMRTSASSPRLQGILADPLDLQPIADKFVPEVISKRIQAYANSQNPYVPVEPDSFEHLYVVGNRNLRNAFKFSEDYAMWLKLEEQPMPQDSAGKKNLIEAWFAHEADKAVLDTKGVGARAWGVFDGIVQAGGSISPSDFQDFGFESSQAMRPHLAALENATLIDSAVDETDHRRKTISVTSRGWVVNYQRKGYKL